MARYCINRIGVDDKGAPVFEWVGSEPRIIDGDCVVDRWEQDPDGVEFDPGRAHDFGSEAEAARWAPCIPGEKVRATRLGDAPDPPPPPVEDPEAKRQAAVSTFLVARAKDGDAEALAAVEVRASRGDAAAAEYLAEEQRKAEEEAARIEAERLAAEEAARQEAEATPTEEPARTR